MAASTPARFLTTGTDERALALKLFLGQVFGQFLRATRFLNRISFVTVTNGKSWQFIRHGKQTADEHIPGTELLGTPFPTTEGLVTIDDSLVSHADLAVEDEQLAHFSIRGPLAVEMGDALAQQLDQRISRLMVIGARTAAVSGIHPGGQQVVRAGVDVATAYPISPTGAKNLRDDLWRMARLFDEDDQPDDDRFCYITPFLHEVLGQDDRIWDRDFDGSGFPDRVLGRIGGFNIILSNNIPQTNVATGPTKYQIDATLTAALCAQGNMGIGGVKRQAMRVFIGDDERRRTTFFKSELRCGFGVIRTESLGEISVSGV